MLPRHNTGSANFDGLHKTCQMFEKISACDNKGISNFISHQQNCFFGWKNLPCDNTDSLTFQVTSSKLPYLLQKLQLLIVGALQIFKSHQQNCFILAKILPGHNRGSTNF